MKFTTLKKLTADKKKADKLAQEKVVRVTAKTIVTDAAKDINNALDNKVSWKQIAEAINADAQLEKPYSTSSYSIAFSKAKLRTNVASKAISTKPSAVKNKRIKK